MKTFPLADFENYINDDDLLEAGLQLFEYKKVGVLQEVEKHLWTATVDGYLTELLLTPSKVKDWACGKLRQRRKMSPYIVAMLYALRQHKEQQATIKANIAPKPKTTSSYTTTRFINATNEEDLRLFIQQYARHNRLFALEFKAQFAHNVTTSNPYEKYTQILQQTKRLCIKSDGTLNIRLAKRLAKISNDLIVQAENGLLEKHFVESIVTAQAIIDEITPISNKKENYEVVKDILEKSFNIIKQSIHLNIPPDLKQTIFEYCNAALQKRGFYKWYIPLLEIMQPLAVEQTQLDTFKERLNHALERKGNNDNLLFLKWQFDLATNNKEVAKKTLKEHSKNIKFMLLAIAHCRDKEDIAKAIALSEIAVRHCQTEENKIILHQYLLDFAIEQQDINLIQEHSRKLFLLTHNFDYFLSLKNIFEPHEWKVIRTNTITTLLQLPATIARRKCLIEIYAKEYLWVDLLQYLKKVKSIIFLQQYAKELSITCPDEFGEVYADILRYFLQYNLGRKNAQIASQSLQQLRTLGHKKLVANLTKEFKTKYAERHTLMEMI